MTNKTQESNLDQLIKKVRHYRSGEHFKEILNACSRFRNLAPYNAMLIEMQRPGSEYVLTREQWEERYNRVIKPNARPLIILVPFGPVEFVFEIGDTKQMKKDGIPQGPSDMDILNEIAEPYKIKQDVPKKLLDNLRRNLVFYGIDTDLGMVAGASYGAKIELLQQNRKEITIPINRNQTEKWQAGYLLSVNRNAENSEQFASICHELGHLFCYHLPMPTDWKEKMWEVRHPEHKWKEFEAESVSWIVCERLGIHNPSEYYLANYVDTTDTESYISEHVSVERIMTAANEIERMLKPLSCCNGYLYKHCGGFKQLCRQVSQEKEKVRNGQLSMW